MGLFLADYEDQEPQILDFVVKSVSLMGAHHIQLEKSRKFVNRVATYYILKNYVCTTYKNIG
jgi:hypothetical protein